MTKTNNTQLVGSTDVLTIIKLAKNGFLDASGCLIGKDMQFLKDSSVFQCLTIGNKAPHYNRFLELKANNTASKKPKDSEKTIKKTVNKKRKTTWDWSDNE